MARTALHIVEPTLNGPAGHCHALVQALAEAARDSGQTTDTTIWAGRRFGNAWPGPGQLRPHFHRRLRRLEAYVLYRRLLAEPGRILVSTATSADFLLADWAASGPLPPHKLYLFVHWVYDKPVKQARLARLAQRQPQLEILAPTQAVATYFRSCGFRTTQVAYPLTPGLGAHTGASAPFKHLLVPGGARTDKGIAHIADLVDALQRRGADWPITVQVSHEDRHRGDPALAAALDRLRASTYPGLQLREDTPNAAAYRALFDGAVVLQPYLAEDFANRVSGVTLDALAAGAPVVATAGTWMAALVQRFGAGAATADLSAAGLIAAIGPVLAQHADYQARAQAASRQVQAEYSARGLIDAVLA